MRNFFIGGIVFLFLFSCREYHYFMDMMDSPAIDTHERKWLPPEGTLPYKAKFYPIEGRKVPDDYVKAGEILKSPFGENPPTEILLMGERGYKLYCSVCHGVDGKGQGPMKKYFPIIPPLVKTPIRTPVSLKWKVGGIYHVIYKGYNTMRSYASQIPSEKMRWAIAHYVKFLQQESMKNP